MDSWYSWYSRYLEASYSFKKNNISSLGLRINLVWQPLQKEVFSYRVCTVGILLNYGFILSLGTKGAGLILNNDK